MIKGEFELPPEFKDYLQRFFLRIDGQDHRIVESDLKKEFERNFPTAYSITGNYNCFKINLYQRTL